MPLGSGLPTRLPESSGAGGTFYVNSSTGSDAANGSAATPWLTLNKALSTVAAGSIIKATGTFSSSGGSYCINFARVISTSDPITLMADTGGATITNGSPTTSTFGAYIHGGATGLRLRGLTFRVNNSSQSNVGCDGVLIEGGSRIEFDGCTFNESGSSGILVRGGASATTSDDIWVINCWFRPQGSNPYAQVTGCGWASTQYFGCQGSHWIYAGQYWDGSNNEVVSGARRMVIANNRFVGSTAGYHLQLGPQLRDSFVVGNTFYGNHNTTAIPPSGSSPSSVYAGDAITIFSQATGTSFRSSNNVIANNEFVDLYGHAVYQGGSLAGSGNSVHNNHAYHLTNGNGFSNRTSQDYEPIYETGDASGFTVGTNVTNSDPLFVNPGAYNFTLQSGSPSLAQADPVYAYPTDANGVSRDPSTPSIGALETAGAGGGGGGTGVAALVQQIGLGHDQADPVPALLTLSGVTAGNTLVLCTSTPQSGNAVNSVTDNTGNTWTKHKEEVSGAFDTAQIWVAENVVGGTTTLSINWTASRNSTLQLSEWSGLQASFSGEPTGSQDNLSGTTHSSGSATATADSLAIACLSLNTAATKTADTFTALANVTGIFADYGRAAYRLLVANGSAASSGWTTGTADTSGGAIVLLPIAPPPPPGNTTLPVITGTAQVGASLTTSNGTWTGSPTGFTYQWQSSPDGTTWTNIAAATTSGYTPVSGDIGKFIRCNVTASNATGGTTASSAATAAVIPNPPQFSAAIQGGTFY